MNGRGKKLSTPKTQNKFNNIRNAYILKKKTKIEDRTTKSIWTLFTTEEVKKEKEIRKKKKENMVD